MAGAVLWKYGYFQNDENRMQDNIERVLDRKGMPPKKPGDQYTVGGTLIGIILGVMLGFYIGMVWVFIVGAIGGGIIGTLIGEVVGERIMKNRNDSKNKLNYS